MPTGAIAIRACPCCGLVQNVPEAPRRLRPCCARCGTPLVQRGLIARSNRLTAALTLSALILYPFAIGLPMIEVERFGHATAASILKGISGLLAQGHWFVGLIVLVCSIVAPMGKILALLILSGGGFRLRAQHRAWTYRFVEWTGRWGMLDVLLVAILVAVVKLGDIVEVNAGPAAIAFGTVVVLSLLASASFDPHGLWEEAAGDAPTPADASPGEIRS